MPILVHIADEKNSRRILKSGITPSKRTGVVYFMPVVRSFFVSHQWIRELRRGGARVLVGINFRLPASELVWVGRYNEPHKQMGLGEAIKQLDLMADPLGYEMFVERKILAKEITRIRHLPQKIGWRYMPHAHGKELCVCPACVRRGSYGSGKLREKYREKLTRRSYNEIKALIESAKVASDVADHIWPLQNRVRRVDPIFMERLLGFNDDDLLFELASTLAYFKHENSVKILSALLAAENNEVREAAQNSLEVLAGRRKRE